MGEDECAYGGHAAETSCRICRRRLCRSCMTDHHHEGHGTPADSQ